MIELVDEGATPRRQRAPQRELRLLHASDCHLGLSSRMSPNEDAFVALIDLAAAEAVDALVIAGDLFDTPRADLPALEWTAAQLDRLACPAVILPGNHDIYGEQSVFTTMDFERRCANVHVLDEPGGELVCLTELDAAFFGRAVHDHAPSFRPMADVPPRPDAGWCVLIGHGLVLDSEEPSGRGSPIYRSELAAIDWDYVALGHVATYQVVQAEPVPVVYAGNTARSHGGRPGAVLVEMIPDAGVTATWTALGD